MTTARKSQGAGCSSALAFLHPGSQRLVATGRKKARHTDYLGAFALKRVSLPIP